MISKRGISPLLATVLIVGFTVAIAALIFLFLKGQVELTGKKGEIKFTPNEEAQVQFQITECKVDGSNLNLKFENSGSNRIDCFWIAPENHETKLTVLNMKEGDEKELTLAGYTINDETPISSVEAYPCLIEKDKVKTGSSSVKASCS